MEAKAYDGDFRKSLFEAIWRDLDLLEDHIEEPQGASYGRLFPLLRDMETFGLLLREE